MGKRKAASEGVLRRLQTAYENNELTKDVVDTLGGALVGLGYQSLFTDMTPEEMALAAGLGAGTAFAVRPVGKYVGRKIGEGTEARISRQTSDGIQERFGGATSIIPGTPGSLQLYKNIPILESMAKGGYKQNFTRKDGTEKTLVEGLPNLVGRQYSDAVAQLGITLVSPYIFGQTKEEQAAEEIAKLEGALAELNSGIR